MSVKVSSWVWHGDETADLNGNEMILMLALADVAADDGRCIYLSDDEELTYAGLASKARVDRRTVIRLVGKLRERGLLEQTKGRKGQPNEFTIAVPWRSGDKLSPQDSVTAGTDSVTAGAGFGDKAGNHSSYRRTDVTNVSPAEPKTKGEQYSLPLCEVLIVEMTANGSKVPSRVPQPWLDAARLLIDRDGRDPHEAKSLLEWACRDSFWRSNILSMPKFRERYDQLRLKRQQMNGQSTVDRGRTADQILAAREQQLAVSA